MKKPAIRWPLLLPLALLIGAAAQAACPGGTTQVISLQPNMDGSLFNGHLVLFLGYTTPSNLEDETNITVTAGVMQSGTNGGLVCLTPGLYSVQHHASSTSVVYTTFWTPQTSLTPVTVASIESVTANIPLNLLSPTLSAAAPLSFAPLTGIFSCPTCGTGDGTLSSFSIAALPSWMTGSVANATTTPALTLGAAYTPLNPSNNLSDVGSAATARTNLGLGTAATQSSGSFDAVGAAATAQANAIAASDPAGSAATAQAAAIAASLQRASNLSDLGNAGTARTNLGLGSAAIASTSAFDASGAAATAQANALALSLQIANNLSDLASAPTARTNLGLGTAATQSTSAFDASGAAAAAQAAAISASLQKSGNLADLASAPTARTNLGLGSAALVSTAAFDAAGAATAAQAAAIAASDPAGAAATAQAAAISASDPSGAAAAAQAAAIAASDPTGSATAAQAAAIAASLQRASNLSDLANAGTARTNLGLGSAAVVSTSAFEVPLTFGAGLNRATNTISIPNAGVTNAMLANPSVTVNGTPCTLGGSCSPAGGSAVTSLTGDVTGSGPGATAATVAFVAGSSAANVHAAELAANAATPLNTVSTLVARDGSGNFTATTITASLTGLASLNEVPLTFGSGLSRTTNTITIPAAGVTNAMLAGSITASKLVQTDISIASTQVTGLPTFPVGTIVGTLDNQTLTNKTLDGVSPTVMGYVDATSSIQTQLSGKQAALGYTAENTASKDTASGYAGLSAGTLLKIAEMPGLTGDCTTSNGAVAVTCGALLHAASNLSDLASAPTARTNLGLGTASTHATADFDASGAAATAQAAAIATAEAASDPAGSAATAQTNAIAASAQRASNLSDLASASTARTNLGLGTASTQATSAFDASGAAATAQANAIALSLQVASNLSDLASASTARTNLGLGTASTQASSAFDTAGAAAAALAASLQYANNLSDLASVPAARTNLGLGTAATHAATDFEPPVAAGTTLQYYRGDKTFATLSSAVWANLSATSPIAFNSSTGVFSCSTCLTTVSIPVTSVFGRTGDVVATGGDYTTAQVTESGNLYFTSGRAQSALAGLYEVPLTFGAGLSRTTNTIIIPGAAVVDSMLATGISPSKVGNTVAQWNASQINGVPLASLATGLLKNTTTTGVPSAATAGDVVALFASCTGIKLLAADGSCYSQIAPPSGTGFVVVNSSVTGAVTFSGDSTASTTTGVMVNTGLNGVSLAGLATGILKNTTGTGAPSIATSGDFPVLNQATTGNAATATALAAVPAACASSNYANAIAANGNLTCAQVAYSQVTGTPSLPTFPGGAIVGTSDTQTLTNKTLDGVGPATMAFVDPSSSIQTQLNARVQVGTDIGGTAAAPQVTGVKGVPLCTGFTPATGQALTYTTASSPNPCYTATAAGGSLPGGTASQTIVYNGSNVGTATTLSGGATLSNSGVVTLGNPGPSTLGGIESLAAASHFWINAISTAGVPSAAQPVCADLSDAGSACQAAAPASSIVGITDTQALTNKTLDGVSPATMAFLDATSSIQTQINSKAGALGYTPLNPANNLSDLASAGAGRTNLGLGTASTQPSSAFDSAGAAATVSAASLQRASNLSDLASAATARSNLGLAAIAASGAVNLNTCLPVIYTASGTINLYALVVVNGGGTVQAALTTSDGTLGVAQAAVTNGQPVPVCYMGVTQMVMDTTALTGNLAVPSPSSASYGHDSGVSTRNSVGLQAGVSGTILSGCVGGGCVATVALDGANRTGRQILLGYLPTIPASATSGFAAVATSASASDLSAGTLAAARLPAFSGDCTSSAGTATLTCGSGGSLAHTGADINTSNQVVSTHLTAPLPVAQGGTGGATAAAAFNDLSPLTTAGDLLYGGAAGAGTRLAAGSASQVLLGGTTPAWGAVDLGSMVTGSLASTSVSGLPTFPAGTIIGTTDTQTLTNKSLDGVSPATMVYVDPTSSIQTQLNGKQAALGFTPLNAASNLSDLISAATARTNLGLGSAALLATSAFDTAGAAATAQANAIAASDTAGAAATAQTNAEAASERPLTFGAGLNRATNTITVPASGITDSMLATGITPSKVGNSTAQWNASQINGVSLSSLATGILKNTTTTGVPSAAASADVISLFASCTGVELLAADGNCYAPSGGNNQIISHAFSGTQELAYAHNLNTLTPVVTCYTGSGAGAVEGTDYRKNLTTAATLTTTYITATAATLGCAFNNSGGVGATGPSGSAPSGTGYVAVNSGVASAVTVSGDGTLNTTTGVLTVTRLNGVSLGGLATGILKNTATTGVPSIAIAADFPTLNQATTGNAATATALAATPTACATGQYAKAAAASGNLTCAQVAYSQVSGTPTLPTFPAGAIVGTTDTQALTNKTLDGVTSATMAFLDATSSIQTQLNGKATALGFTPLNVANNLSDVASVSTSRTNLGLGTAATQASSAFDAAGTAATAQAAAIAVSAQRASNLSDLASAATARTNLGLGNAAVQNTTAFEVPLTFGAGLNRTTNTITIPAAGVTNAMLAGSITAAKLVQTDISIASTQVTGLPTFPAGTIIGTSDTQTLTNKTLDGVSPTTMGYVDPTSSIQTQLNGKASTAIACRSTTTFSGVSTVTVLGSAHLCATASLSVTVYDTTGSLNTRILPDSVSVNRSTFDVTVGFAVSQTGIIVIQ